MSSVDPYILQTLFTPMEDNFLLDTTSNSSEEENSEKESRQYEISLDLFKNFPRISPYLFVQRFTAQIFLKTFHISKDTYTALLGLFWDKTPCQKIHPEKSLLILLWFLRSDEYFTNISKRFQVDINCIKNIIREGVKVLSNNAVNTIKFPSKMKLNDISKSYYEISRIDDVVGSIEVSHFKIPPRLQYDNYINENGYYSIAVQGIVTVDCKFMDIFLCEGSNSNAEIFYKSHVDLTKLHNKFIVGFKSCYSCDNIVTPFPDTKITKFQQKTFNKNLEIIYTRSLKAFGYLKGRFQRLERIQGDPTFISDLIRACCVVHNICIDVEGGCHYFVRDRGIFECLGDLEDNDENPKRDAAFNKFIE